jgi:hypothetical protein
MLVHVAVGLLGLVALSAFALDYGLFYVSRVAAQNSADAGAMAGAISLAYDDSTDFTDAGPAKQAAFRMTQRNLVFGQPPDVDVTTDITFPVCPDGTDPCIRVDVHRNQARGNPLPMFAGILSGLTSQNMRASATAQVVYGDATECLLPFAIPDRWRELRQNEAGAPPSDSPLNYPRDERYGDFWDPDDTYDAYDRHGNPLAGPVDTYDPNVDGYTPLADYGVEFTIKSPQGSGSISPGWYFPIVLPDGCGTGAACYEQRIRECSHVEIPEDHLFVNEPGAMVGPTRQGITDLIREDLGASWDSTHVNPDGTMGRVTGGCMAAGTCGISPRLRPVAVFDLERYMAGQRSGRLELVVTGFVGMFVDRMVGNDVRAYMTTLPFNPNANNVTEDTSSFLRAIVLVR